MSKDIFINGPINAYNVEGNINGITKKLILFGDWHLPLDQQDDCDNVRAIDIKDYLVNIFDNIANKDKVIDFFVELYTYELNDLIKGKSIYINEIVKLFQKSIKIKDNEITQSDEFKNVRFHYIDIRNELQNEVNNIYNNLNSLIEAMWSSLVIYPNDFNVFKDSLNFIYYDMNLLLNFLKNPTNKKIVNPKLLSKKYKYKEYNVEVREYILDKIMNKYKNNNIKKIINDIIKEEFIPRFEIYLKYIKQFIDYINEISIDYNKINVYTLVNFNKSENILDDERNINYGHNIYNIINIIHKLKSELLKVNNYHVLVISKLMDIYTLRRFLDKDYVKYGINYTGIAHSSFTIYCLVKYFNFKLVNQVYTQIDIDSLNDKIKKSDYNKIYHYFLPNILHQCINLKSFPIF